jgi:hypothetical protein
LTLPDNQINNFVITYLDYLFYFWAFFVILYFAYFTKLFSEHVEVPKEAEKIIHGTQIPSDILLHLYHEFNCNRIDYNKIKWNTVKTFTSLNGLFITGIAGIFIYKREVLNQTTKLFPLFLALAVIVISILGSVNLKREARLLWEQEASMFKIEKYLGLHEQIPSEKRWLTGDPYLVPSRNLSDSEYKDRKYKEVDGF